MSAEFLIDWQRAERTGTPEAVLCAEKSVGQIGAIAASALERGGSLLFTRLSADKYEALDAAIREVLVYSSAGETARIGGLGADARKTGIAIITAGTSDGRVASECAETLDFLGFDAPVFADMGVAGLWRLMDRLEEIRRYRVLIAIAGMEGALFSVLGGLVASPVIAVPSSVGYGVSHGGYNALLSALGSCASGMTVVNIDNGFGAATAAGRILNAGSTV